MAVPEHDHAADQDNDDGHNANPHSKTRPRLRLIDHVCNSRGWGSPLGYTAGVTPDKPADIPSLADFIGACDASFAFLILEHGFARVAETMDHSPFGARYRQGERAVDIYGESYGKTAACSLLRGTDRIDLVWMLPAAERKKLPNGQLAQVAALAEQLKQHASDFLSGDTARYDTALAEWKSKRPRPPQ